MSTLSDFTSEIAVELDARRCGGPPLPGFSPDKWIDFCRLFAVIDRDETHAELRAKLEQIASRKDLRFQDRCAAMLPLLRVLDPSARLY